MTTFGKMTRRGCISMGSATPHLPSPKLLPPRVRIRFDLERPNLARWLFQGVSHATSQGAEPQHPPNFWDPLLTPMRFYL